MIDLIKTLVQTLMQLIPQIRGMRIDERKRQLGATLFLLYVSLNETVLVADDIISGLEAYVDAMRRYRVHVGPTSFAHPSGGRRIAREVQHQVTNLARLHRLIYDRSIMLQIIDAESYNRLIWLLNYKFSALMRLRRIMESGSLPMILPDTDKLGELMKLDINEEFLQHAMEDIYPHWYENENTLSTTAEWGDDVYDKIVAYLEERKPREQLAEIRESLSSLRKALESNFSITDILLEVGDKRMETPSF